MSRSWIQQRERGSPFLIRFIARTALALGRPVGRLMLYPIVAYFVLFSRRARRASRGFLTRVLGRRAGLGAVFRHYHTFASTILDRVFLLSGRLDPFDIQVQGEEVLFEQLTRGRGCLLLGSHLGSFEVLRVLAEQHPELRVRPLMYRPNAEKVNKVLNALNPTLAQRVIPIGEPDSLLRVRQALEEGDLVGILGDRLALDDKSVTCRFFDHPCRFPAGPMLLAGLLHTPVVLFFGLYLGGNRYRIRFELLTPGIHLEQEERIDQVAEWSCRYAERLEHYCRQTPYNWFNFYDFWEEAADDARKAP